MVINWCCYICGKHYSSTEQNPTPIRGQKGEYLKLCKTCSPKVKKVVEFLKAKSTLRDKILRLFGKV